MSQYLLIYAKNFMNPHFEGDIPTIAFPKGGVFLAREMADGYGSSEGLPNFLRVEITDTALSVLEQYQSDWVRNIQFQVLSSDVPTDTHQIRFYSLNPGTGEGHIQYVLIEKLLTLWNMPVVTNDGTQVVVSANIYNGLISKGFWARDNMGGITFNELAYDTVTGEHTIEMNYTAAGFNSSAIDKKVRERGGVILSHAGKTVTYNMSRADLRTQFQNEVLAKTKTRVRQMRYRIPSTLVDTIVAAGGTYQATLAQLQAQIIDDGA